MVDRMRQSAPTGRLLDRDIAGPRAVEESCSLARHSRVPQSLVNIAHIGKVRRRRIVREITSSSHKPGGVLPVKKIHHRRNLYRLTLFICSQSNTGGRHHDENSFGDGCYSRIHCTFIRAAAAGQNYRSSATIRCFLVLPGSGYRDDEMSSCQCPACRWWQHEGYRCRSSDTGRSANSFGG